MNKERKEYKKAYYEAHKKELKEKQKTYNEAHKEEAKAYYEEHKQERKEYSKKYMKSYNDDHKNEHKEYYKTYNESHREHKLRKYCINIEQVENYELAKEDNFISWDVHHRLETHNSDGIRRLVDLSRDELIALGTYYHRPASELIFLKHKEHIQLHIKKYK